MPQSTHHKIAAENHVADTHFEAQPAREYHAMSYEEVQLLHIQGRVKCTYPDCGKTALFESERDLSSHLSDEHKLDSTQLEDYLIESRRHVRNAVVHADYSKNVIWPRVEDGSLVHPITGAMLTECSSLDGASSHEGASPHKGEKFFWCPHRDHLDPKTHWTSKECAQKQRGPEELEKHWDSQHKKLDKCGQRRSDGTLCDFEGTLSKLRAHRNFSSCGTTGVPGRPVEYWGEIRTPWEKKQDAPHGASSPGRSPSRRRPGHNPDQGGPRPHSPISEYGGSSEEEPAGEPSEEPAGGSPEEEPAGESSSDEPAGPVRCKHRCGKRHYNVKAARACQHTLRGKYGRRPCPVPNCSTNKTTHEHVPRADGVVGNTRGKHDTTSHTPKGADFPSKAALEKHLRDHHLFHEGACRVCGWPAYSPKDMQEHEKMPCLPHDLVRTISIDHDSDEQGHHGGRPDQPVGRRASRSPDHGGPPDQHAKKRRRQRSPTPPAGSVPCKHGCGKLHGDEKSARACEHERERERGRRLCPLPNCPTREPPRRRVPRADGVVGNASGLHDTQHRRRHFLSKALLEKHLRDVHNFEEMKCLRCKKEFPSAEAMEDHLQLCSP